MLDSKDTQSADSSSAQCLAPQRRRIVDSAARIGQPDGVRLAQRAAVQGSTRSGGTSPRARLAHFRLDFDDGSSLTVRGRGLIGRDPVACADEKVEHLVALADDTLSVSRTHLEFGIGEPGLWIRDCASTNGSEIELNDHRIVIEPGLRVAAPPGSTIHMGARQVKVQTLSGPVTIGVATIDWGGATHVGAVRKNNEDTFCAEPPVFVVADGVGGHFAGDVASREAVKALLPLAGHVQVTGDMLRACLADARARIGRISGDHGRPPGTTLSGVIVTQADDAPYWLVVNIGDSRTYRLDSSGFRQISMDHSIAQELINTGRIAPAAAKSIPMRNVLTRALLAGIEHPADMWLLRMIAGDRVLVCSDGLTTEVHDRTIAAVLRATPDPQAAANELAKMAVDAGGHDNVTVLVVDAVAGPAASAGCSLGTPRSAL
jgi:PPM family protein phosphatase